MGRAHPPQGDRSPSDDHPRDGGRFDMSSLGMGTLDVRALIEENARLKQLVIALSRLVLKNVIDRE